MALSNSSSLATLVGEIVASDAQSAAYANRVLRPLVRNYVVPPGAGSIVVPRFNKVAVDGLTEGVAPGSTQMSTIGETLIPQERGAYVQISKRALHADPFQDLAPYGEQLGRSLAEDEDAQILSVMNFSERITGAVNRDSVLDAVAHLEAANVPGPYFAVFHPTAWANMRGELSDAGAFASVGKQVVEGFGEGFTNSAGYVGSPYGLPCFISTQVTDDEGVFFSREAVAVAYIKDLGVDVDDNVVSRAMDLMAWYSVDTTKLVDEYGVLLGGAA